MQAPRRSRTLHLYANETELGQIHYDARRDRWSLKYAASWAANPHAFPVSNIFPLERHIHHSDAVRDFVDNLLPEGRALDAVSMAFQVSKADTAGLIAKLGRDTAGALEFREAGASIVRPPARQRVTARDLDERSDHPDFTLYLWDEFIDYAIAGVQDKLAIHADPATGQCFVARGLTASHIVKPSPQPWFEGPLRHLVVNEFFCMQLGAAVLGRARVAPVQLLRTPSPMLLVQRFDRRWRKDRESFERLHIIDGCQALNLPARMKYEQCWGHGADVAHVRDGASLEQLFTLAQGAPESWSVQEALLDWVIFNLMIGNADAHAKNLSFLVKPTGLALAPHYDLLSTVVFPSLDSRLAMAVGDAFTFEETWHALEWAEFAGRCGLPRQWVARRLCALARAVPRAAHALLEKTQGSVCPDEDAFLQRIVQHTETMATGLLRAAARIRGVRFSDLTERAAVRLAGVEAAKGRT